LTGFTPIILLKITSFFKVDGQGPAFGLFVPNRMYLWTDRFFLVNGVDLIWRSR